MSTRCQIGFYDKDGDPLDQWQALIYRHCDGYPDEGGGVCATVGPILAKMSKSDRRDTECAAAELVAALIKGGSRVIGITKGLHGDEEYFYAVSPERMRCFSVEYNGFADMKELPKYEVKFKD